MSSPDDWEGAVQRPALGGIDARELDYDSTSNRGRRVLRSQHERLQSLLKSKNLCTKD